MRTKEFSIWDSLRLNGRGIWKADEKKKQFGSDFDH